MIEKEQSVLLELIKNALFQCPIELPDSIDWNVVYDESVEQTVTSLIADSVPAENGARFKETQMSCRAHYMKVLYEQNMLVKLLSDNRISSVIIKGISAAKYYPIPHNRIMGDIDILVPVEDYERAKDVLINNAYLLDHEDINRHAAYAKNGVCIELHYCFSTDCPRLEEYLAESFSDIQQLSINGFCVPVLPEAINGLLILAHIRHHILGQGLGLRQITDWEMFVHSHSDLDFWRNDFMPKADACGLTDFAIIITRLCRKYLALPDEILWCNEVDAPRLEFIMECIFEAGNFGSKTGREETDAERVSLRIKKAIKNRELFKMLQTSGQENWKACQKHPFLRHFAFIYQAFRYLFRGIKAALHGGAVKDLSSANDRFEIYKAFELNEKQDIK